MLLLLHFPVIMCLNVIFCFFSVSFQSRFRTQFFPLIHVLVVQMVKSLSGMQETWVQSLGWEDSLEKAMAPHYSTLAWKIPWTEEPGRLQSMGSQRVGHDWATSLSFSLSYLTLSPTFIHRTIYTNLQYRQFNRIHRSMRYKNVLSQHKDFKLKIKCLFLKGLLATPITGFVFPVAASYSAPDMSYPQLLLLSQFIIPSSFWLATFQKETISNHCPLSQQ